MEIKQVVALAIAFMVAGFVGLSTITSEERTITQTGGDAASALGNLTTVLEALVDPIVTLLVLVFVIAMVFRIFDKMKGKF